MLWRFACGVHGPGVAANLDFASFGMVAFRVTTLCGVERESPSRQVAST